MSRSNGDLVVTESRHIGRWTKHGRERHGIDVESGTCCRHLALLSVSTSTQSEHNVVASKKKKKKENFVGLSSMKWLINTEVCRCENWITSSPVSCLLQFQLFCCPRQGNSAAAIHWQQLYRDVIDGADVRAAGRRSAASSVHTTRR